MTAVRAKPSLFEPRHTAASRCNLRQRGTTEDLVTGHGELLLAGLAKALRPWMEQLAPCAEKLRPQVNGIMHELGRAADTVAHATAPALHALTDAAGPYVEVAATWANTQFAGYESWQVALLTASVTVLVIAAIQVLWRRSHFIRKQGVLQYAFLSLRSAPIVRTILAKEKAKIAAKISAGIKRDSMTVTTIPKQGRPAAAVLELLKAREARNIRVAPGTSSMSGVVYISSEAHKQLLDEAYALFSWTNSLHADVFPSVRQMEAEVVAMTATMMHGGPSTSAPAACGAMTSGGTESILLAVKAARDYMATHKGITHPEMVVGASAHAAYWKAAEYFNIKLVKAPLGQDYRLHGSTVSHYITRNTILVVASAPGFPHGVVDDISNIATAAHKRGVLCHVDACLGGYLLPFIEQLGYEVPVFDFRVPGVTSISVDTHKFGMAHKGTSVILYRRPDIRQHQFTAITDWTGGLYISPSMAGSRSGALIATAWASLMHLGQDGLLNAADGIMHAVQDFRRQLQLHLGADLHIIGQPHASVIAFQAVNPKQLNIYVLSDMLTAKGWHFNALQRPAALHFCFTAQHVNVVPSLIRDLREAVAALKSSPKGSGSEGSAPLYGLAGASPDRGLIGEFLVTFQDQMLVP